MITIPFRAGSAKGDRFPWKSGHIWISFVKYETFSKFFWSAIVCNNSDKYCCMCLKNYITNNNRVYEYIEFILTYLLPLKLFKIPGVAGWVSIIWSSNFPVALCPPSLNHIPGTMALKYGPQTPLTKSFFSLTIIWQVDVPQINAANQRD